MSEPAVEVGVARTAPRTADVVGLAVASQGAVPRQLGLGRAALSDHGFTGAVGQTLIVPRADGPTLVAVGIGPSDELDADALRNAAAAFTRAAGKRAHIATNLTDVDGVDAASAGQAVAEGVLLATYRYVGLKNDTSIASTLRTLTLIASEKRAGAVERGAGRGITVSSAASLARELANTPPDHLTARNMADKAVELAGETGLDVEVFDKDRLTVMGCGGILSVNKASAEPPRVVRLTYTPRNPTGHIALVGKGVMYDSGGISLKQSDAMHAVMKMDMSGAAAVLAAMSTLKALRCKTKVTGYLMCTDNMPSGSAMKLGDVLTMRNGKTVEVHNTDAEGRLILADGLSLAVEDEPDAIVDIATLTGACLVALGTSIAGVLGTESAPRRPGEGECRTCRRAGVAAPARREAVSQVAGLRDGRHEERRWPLRGSHHGLGVPVGVRRRGAVGAPRHRRPDEGRRRRGLAVEGRHRFRHPPPDRPRHQLRTGLLAPPINLLGCHAFRLPQGSAAQNGSRGGAGQDARGGRPRWRRSR